MVSTPQDQPSSSIVGTTSSCFTFLLPNRRVVPEGRGGSVGRDCSRRDAPMKATGPNMRVRTTSVWTANALAWGGGVWLWFGPSYRGVSVTPVLPDGSGGEATQFYRYAHRGEWRGCRVVVTCARPFNDHCVVGRVPRLPRGLNRKILLWCAGLALLVFCMLAIFSIGILYVPAALALLVAAVTDLHAAEVATAKGVTLEAVVAERTEPSLG